MQCLTCRCVRYDRHCGSEKSNSILKGFCTLVPIESILSSRLPSLYCIFFSGHEKKKQKVTQDWNAVPLSVMYGSRSVE